MGLLRASRRAGQAAILALAGLTLGASAADADEPVAYAVVVNPAAQVRDVSLGELSSLYRGRRMEDGDGRVLVPLNHPAGTAARTDFDRVVLGMTPDEVGRFWVDQKMRGASHPPRTAGSANMLLRFVANFPAAVGYVEADKVAGMGDAVRVLKVDGKLPGEPGYALAKGAP